MICGMLGPVLIGDGEPLHTKGTHSHLDSHTAWTLYSVTSQDTLSDLGLHL